MRYHGKIRSDGRRQVKSNFVQLVEYVRSSRTHALRSDVANKADFFVGGSSLHAIERRIAREQPSNKETSPRSDRRPAKQRMPFRKARAAKTRSVLESQDRASYLLASPKCSRLAILLSI